MSLSTNDQVLQKTTHELTTVLAHIKKLFRVRNQLCSPLLRLSFEIIVRVLSFIMIELYPLRPWTPIYCTCHRIRAIMRSATGLWWKVDCKYGKAADFVFVRSGGGPRAIFSDLRTMHRPRLLQTESLLDNWRDKLEFRGHRLHTLEFYGSPSILSHFSWILERPLPRLE